LSAPTAGEALRRPVNGPTARTARHPCLRSNFRAQAPGSTEARGYPPSNPFRGQVMGQAPCLCATSSLLDPTCSKPSFSCSVLCPDREAAAPLRKPASVRRGPQALAKPRPTCSSGPNSACPQTCPTRPCPRSWCPRNFWIRYGDTQARRELLADRSATTPCHFCWRSANIRMAIFAAFATCLLVARYARRPSGH